MVVEVLGFAGVEVEVWEKVEIAEKTISVVANATNLVKRMVVKASEEINDGWNKLILTRNLERGSGGIESGA